MSGEYFRIMGRKGSGTFGEVFAARDLRKLEHEENAHVAIKKIFLGGYEADADEVNEFYVLQELMGTQNPNILKVLEPAYVQDGFLCLVLELCKHNLQHEITNFPPTTTEIKDFLRQILNGVKEFHDLGILHRDLKPTNILVKDIEGGKVELKIADFGLARQQYVQGKPLTPRVGTAGYQAPEILLGSREYDNLVDMWSLGCIFYELLYPENGKLIKGLGKSDDLGRIFTMFGRPSEEDWPGVSQMESYLNAPVGSTEGLPIDDDINPDAKDLLMRMLTVNPANRISAGEALMHPFLR